MTMSRAQLRPWRSIRFGDYLYSIATSGSWGMVALADLGRTETETAKKALAGISEPTDKPRR